jgi:hypothetical protein
MALVDVLPYFQIYYTALAVFKPDSGFTGWGSL